MNLNRYRYIDFHRSRELTKKIEALFLLYDKQCEDNGITKYFDKIRLLNHYIDTLVNKEEFELAIEFITRKKRKQFKYKNQNRKLTFKLLFRFNIRKVKKFFNFI